MRAPDPLLVELATLGLGVRSEAWRPAEGQPSVGSARPERGKRRCVEAERSAYTKATSREKEECPHGL